MGQDRRRRREDSEHVSYLPKDVREKLRKTSGEKLFQNVETKMKKQSVELDEFDQKD